MSINPSDGKPLELDSNARNTETASTNKISTYLSTSNTSKFIESQNAIVE